jgi:hypothetical protein
LVTQLLGLSHLFFVFCWSCDSHPIGANESLEHNALAGMRGVALILLSAGFARSVVARRSARQDAPVEAPRVADRPTRFVVSTAFGIGGCVSEPGKAASAIAAGKWTSC